ncbi:MAG: glycosyltransferase family 2 protein [Candidatus Omnitrophica bacterium]|nr:glycosyltransferase family 2 protein [Candidatus Omnitrophota bacterium]
MGENPLVSVVIVNFNGRQFLRDCVVSVLAQKHTPLEVVVIDNASTDGSVEMVKKEFPSVIVASNPKNLGFAEGYNIGIKKTRGNLIATLNNDITLAPDWVAEMIAATARHPRAGIFASKQLNARNPLFIDSAGLSLHRGMYGSGRGRGALDQEQYDNEVEVFGACGAAAVFRKKMLDEIGLFDEDFFLYQEELDLCWRAAWRGWKAVYVPGAVAYHIGGATAGAGSAFVRYYMERNRILMLIKNLSLPLLMRYFPYLLKYELDIILRLVLKREWEVARARIDVFKYIGAMCKKRKVIQKGKVIPEKEFMRRIKGAR